MCSSMPKKRFRGRNIASYLSCSEWSSLPLPPTFMILDKLLEPIDHVHFGAVCKEWRSLANEYNRATRRWSNVLPPMLMIPKQTRRMLYSLHEQKMYNIALPYDERNFCGCGHGWLAMINRIGNHELSISLINPFQKSMSPIRLPLLDFVWSIYCWNLYFEKNYDNPKVILSADPTLNPDDYVVIVFYSNDLRMAFIKGGQKHWTFMFHGSLLFDAIIYKGRGFAVDKRGPVFSFELNSPIHPPLQPEIKPNVLRPQYVFERYACRAYLVESIKGELLHVRRFSKLKESPYNDDDNLWMMTYSFKVYRLVFNENEKSIAHYIEVKSIGDEALFVGDSQSMSVLASDYGWCKSNCIYYTDDLLKFDTYDNTDSIVPCDMGMFNLKDGTITRNFYPHKCCCVEKNDVQSAFWISPPFNGLS